MSYDQRQTCGKIIGIDDRMLLGIPGLQLDGTAARGSHGPDMDL